MPSIKITVSATMASAWNLLKQNAMPLGENLRHKQMVRLIGQLSPCINQAAQQAGVDPQLIKAIIYEEQTHQWPYESEIEKNLGLGNTVGLGQVTVGLHGFSRDQLIDPKTNIRVIAKHLKYLQARHGNDITTLATRYNCGSCTLISKYGRRVETFYHAFANETVQ